MEGYKRVKIAFTIIALTLILMLSMGILVSFGVFLVDFKEYFQTGSGIIGAVNGLAITILCLTAPVASIVGQRCGCRIAIIVGCCLTSLGLFLSSQVREPWQLLLSHSVMTGFGCSLIFVHTITLVAIVPNTYLAIANGIVYTGTAVGIMCFPLVSDKLKSLYDLRGALMIISALSLNALVLSLSLKFAETTLIKKMCEQRQDVMLELKEKNECAVIERSTLNTDHDNSDKNDLDHDNNKLSFFGSLKEQVQLCYRFPRFGCLLFGNIFSSIGYVGFVVHMVANAIYIGYTNSQATMIASTFGIGNIIGRLSHGIPIHFGLLSPYRFFCLACIVNVGAMIVYPFCNSMLLLVTVTLIIAYCIGVYLPLQPVLVRTFVGDEYFQQAFGVLQVPGGLGGFVGGFVAGWIFDMTLSYKISFFIMGASYAIVPIAFSLTELLLSKNNIKYKTVCLTPSKTADINILHDVNTV